MNCQQCQQKIFDVLAAGTGGLAPEVAAHQSSCPACAKFFAVQQSLFKSIDAGLQSFVNQPVPASLLPSIRARLDENTVSQRSWFLNWNLATFAALVIAGIVLAHFWQRPTILHTSPGQTTTNVQAISASQRALPLEPHKQSRAVPPNRSERVALTSSAVAAPKVIVPAEERQAFAKFVAEVPQQPQVALAFTHPATESSDATNETALLRIDLVEVKSLDGTEDE